MRELDEKGQNLINSTDSLWRILQDAIIDPRAGSIVIILDGLDECAESEVTDLLRKIQSQFNSGQLSESKLKYLLTCRPYEKIISQFYGLLNSFPNIHIPGEEESEAISQEINLVITHRVNQLSAKKNLTSQIKDYLQTRLQKASNRTYLWVYLVLEDLEQQTIKKTLTSIKSIINTLPKSINEAYEQILSRSQKELEVRKALQVILSASRPLTLSEMNIAMSIDETLQSIYDLDLEDEDAFGSRLKSLCGLFISIYHGKIYFLHQTAREFLLADSVPSTNIPLKLGWHHSITARHAHSILAELCVIYLNLLNSNTKLLIDTDRKALDSVNSAFLDYSARNWGTHFREACVTDDAANMPSTLRISHPDFLKSYSMWFETYWQTTYRPAPANFPGLMIASYFGHCAVFRLFLKKGAEIDIKDTIFCRTPLLWAAENGHEAIIELLLEKGANIEAKGKDGWTPLLQAAQHGHETSFKLLLDRGANIEATDSSGETALVWAAEGGYETIVKMLLENGADVEAKAEEGWTSLLWAADRGHEDIVRLLLENGADVKVQAEDGETPLLQAARHGYKDIVELLLEKGADIKAMDINGQTPLSCADSNGHVAIFKLLVEKLLAEKAS